MSAAPKLDLEQAAAQLRAAATRLGPRERRRFQRLPVIVAGRLLDGAGRELDCRTADISPGDVRIAATALPDVNDQVVIYLEGFGRLAGRVARRCGEGEVAVIFDISQHKREKMAEALTWSANKNALGLQEETPRPAAGNGALVETETGETYAGEVLDLSLTGITLRTAKAPPPIGAWVRIGGTHGRVARYIEGGFAIDLAPRGGYRAINPT